MFPERPADCGKSKILCVVGPTASGKSALAVRLAERFGGEVVSCDSMQLYRGMDIGTAKATAAEMRGIPLHLTDILDICESFSVSDYVKCAADCVDELYKREKLPIFCGGTGLYLDSFISGLAFPDFDCPPEYRAELADYAEAHGAEALHKKLAAVDPEAAAKIPSANVKRVIRALEVCRYSGMTFSEQNRLALQTANKRDALYIGLAFRDRAVLYERIEKRVDEMLAAGLLAETERLLNAGIRATETAGQAIGYKEFYPYFDGEATLEACVERLKINSRHYAKRQLTWLARNPDIRYIYADDGDTERIFKQAEALCESYLNV